MLECDEVQFPDYVSILEDISEERIEEFKSIEIF